MAVRASLFTWPLAAHSSPSPEKIHPQEQNEKESTFFVGKDTQNLVLTYAPLFFKQCRLTMVSLSHPKAEFSMGCNIFVRMLQGLVEGLVDVSMSLTKLSSRLDFFFFIVYLPGMFLKVTYTLGLICGSIDGFQIKAIHWLLYILTSV